MTQFRNLHKPGNPFILANAWDVGSARMLANLGAQAIGTTSAAFAFTKGRPDMGNMTREESLTHAQEIVSAVNIPVSGDFENGFGHDPETCAETVKMAAEVGLAGISIEDMALPDKTAYERGHAVERIRSAASAAKALSNDFVLVARADGVMNKCYDLAEAISRIQAYEKAGADCVYIPVPPSLDALTTICASVSIPVNALVAGPMTKHSRTEFAKTGAARLSLGSALARSTHRIIYDAAKSMFAEGDFSPLSYSISGDTIDELLK